MNKLYDIHKKLIIRKFWLFLVCTTFNKKYAYKSYISKRSFAVECNRSSNTNIIIAC